ncbi:hypothetical protein RIF23_00265 [Lipingzhangella sp. LS1_29]|uniref:Uncharacterized protein n=1 Tax=Lipingzhangella rawalii TaxID=2055835 RepID=A0ABU2H084_9ACTN|nr:hypothetical protein [Lipingzhangella rawalii]MDS1268722.1 hypothetical protein [Lipingzhangella rawalii]
MSDAERPRRVTVMSPATRRARAAVDARAVAASTRGPAGASEVEYGPRSWSPYPAMRRQLTAALLPVTAVVVVLFGGPTLLLVHPALVEQTLWGAPAPLVLAAAAGAVLLALATVAVRRSESLEDGENRWNRW